MEEVIDSLRKIINRWVNTEVYLTEDAQVGDFLLKVSSALRFKIGDEAMLTDGENFEHPIIVSGIIDNTTLEVSSGIRFFWSVSSGAKLKKSVSGKLVQGIYMGEPNNIPRFPAVVVVGDTHSSDWTTFESTTEKYDVSISCYIEDNTLEDGYRALLKLTKIIEHGLKRNLFPLVGEKSHSTVAQEISPGDMFINVEDTSGMLSGQLILIESKFQAEQVIIKSIIDENIIELVQGAFYGYPIQDDPRVVLVTRFLYKCWPKSINYGFVHKDTLLKASKISWSGEEIQQHGPIGWSDTPRD